MSLVTITDMELFCQNAGNGGECVVLLHGLFGASSNLKPIARGLEDRYRCILPDLRNHGRSPHSDQMDCSLMAGDLVELMDKQDIDSAHLLGHSMGGKVAMQFALTHGSRVRSLAVADIAPVSYPPHHTQVLAALDEISKTDSISRRDAQAKLVAALDEPAVAAFLMTNWTRYENGTYGWRFNLSALIDQYDEIAAAPWGEAFQGPTLFIKGELSDYIVSDYRDQTLALFPAARMKVMAGCGHWLHAEKPAIFTRLVRDFISQATSCNPI